MFGLPLRTLPATFSRRALSGLVAFALFGSSPFFLQPGLHAIQVDSRERPKIGDWVEFTYSKGGVKAAAVVKQVQLRRVIVEYDNPLNDEVSRLVLAEGDYQVVSEKEAEAILERVAEQVNKPLEIGDHVRFSHHCKLGYGYVHELPSSEWIKVRYIDPETNRELFIQLHRRTVRHYDDFRQLPEFQEGDRVLVKMSNANEEEVWLPAVLRGITGKTYGLVMFDKDKSDPDADNRAIAKANMSLLSWEERGSKNTRSSKFQVGDLVEVDLNGKWTQGTIIKMFRGKYTVRYFDRASEQYAEEKFRSKQMRQPGSASEDAAPPKKSALPTETRTWTSANGKHTFDGVLVEINGKTIKIKNSTGRVVDVELSRLSPSDNEYVKALEN